MQPDSLSLDPSSRFSVGGTRPEGCGTSGTQQTWPPVVDSASGRTGAFVTTTGASTFELGLAAGARRFPLQICTTEFTNPTPSQLVRNWKGYAGPSSSLSGSWRFERRPLRSATASLVRFAAQDKVARSTLLASVGNTRAASTLVSAPGDPSAYAYLLLTELGKRRSYRVQRAGPPLAQLGPPRQRRIHHCASPLEHPQPASRRDYAG
jgi:hypothetical protein